MLWIFYILTLAQSTCQYTDFDQFQLRSDNFYQEKSYVRGNTYAFGVWTQYAALRKNYHNQNSNEDFDPTRNSAGFHILNFQSEGGIQTLFFQQPLHATNFPNLVIGQNSLLGVQFYGLQQGYYYYEGYWVFTYFSFNYDNKYNFASYNTMDGRFYNLLVTNRRLIKQTTNAKLQYGGQGLYVIGAYKFNLNSFVGRISIITTFESSITFFQNTDKAKFISFVSQCSVPPTCLNPVELHFFNQPYNQHNLTIRNYQVDIKGVICMFDFWIKRDSYKIKSQEEIILTFGGLFSNLDIYYQLQLFWTFLNHDAILNQRVEIYNLVPEDMKTTNIYYAIIQVVKPIQNFEQWSYLKYQFWKVHNYQYIHLILEYGKEYSL